MKLFLLVLLVRECFSLAVRVTARGRQASLTLTSVIDALPAYERNLVRDAPAAGVLLLLLLLLLRLLRPLPPAENLMIPSSPPASSSSSKQGDDTDLA